MIPKKQLKKPKKLLEDNFREISFTENLSGKLFKLKLLKDVKQIPNIKNVTSISVVPIIKKNEILVAKLKRGLDLPGGHIEISDKTLTEALKREVLEEVSAKIDSPIILIGIIQGGPYGRIQNGISYMLVTIAKVKRLKNFAPESRNKKIISFKKFKSLYRAGSKDMMSEIIKRAEFVQDEILLLVRRSSETYGTT